MTVRQMQGLRAVGYVRRSTDRQEQSIGDQKKAIESYVQQHGYTLAGFYVDDAISGTSTVGRREFLRLIDDAGSKTRTFDCVIVYDVKRFGRLDNDEAGYYRHILRSHGVQVVYTSENFTGDSTDDLLRPVKQWQARQESMDLSKVTIRGLLSKLDNGPWWLGGSPPYGYDLQYITQSSEFLHILRFMPDGSKQLLDQKQRLVRALAKGERLQLSGRDRCTLVPGEGSRVSVVHRIFSLYGERGLGWKTIAHLLNQEQIPAPRNAAWGNRYHGSWGQTTVRSILTNPLYAGDLVWNRRTDARFHRIAGKRAVLRETVHGARLVPNDKADWIIVRDAHPALVDRALFEAVQTRKEKKSARFIQLGVPRAGRRSQYILSGLLVCATCGGRYQGCRRVKGKPRIDGSKIVTMYYACGGYINKGKAVCDYRPLKKEVVELQVIHHVLGYYAPLLTGRGRDLLAARVREQLGVQNTQVDEAVKTAKERIATLNATMRKLLDNLTPANREHVDMRLTELSKERHDVQIRLEELNRLSLSQQSIQTTVNDALKFISGLEFMLTQGVPYEKLTALRQCIHKIDVSPDGGLILHCFTVPAGAMKKTEILRATSGE